MKRVHQLCGPVACLVVLLCSCAKSSENTGFDWPQWRGPDGNGQSRETEWDPAAIANPHVLWKVNVGLGYANVAIQNERLFTIGAKRGFTVTCLDAATGRQKWTQSLVSSYTPQATPAVDGNDLFVLTTEGVLHALDSRSGKVRWRKDLVAEYGAVKPYYGFAGSPVVAGDLIILTANSGMALSRATGSLVWGSDPPPKQYPAYDPPTCTGTYYSSPVLYESSGELLAVIAGWEGLAAVKAKTGERVWLFPWDRFGWCEVTDPVISNDGRVLVFAFGDDGSEETALFRPGSQTVGILWRRSFRIMNLVSTPVFIGDRIFAAGSSGKMHCLDLESGRDIGMPDFSDNTFPCMSPIAVDGKLIMLSSAGTLHVGSATPEGYDEITHCDVLQDSTTPRKFWTPPVLCNAKIYCRNFSGDLVCIDVGK